MENKLTTTNFNNINTENNIHPKDENQLQDINLYQKQLKFLYKKIDSDSSLLWSHENHLIGKRLRSENDLNDKELKWKNSKTTQIGYGEITMVILSRINFLKGFDERFV